MSEFDVSYMIGENLKPEKIMTIKRTSMPFGHNEE